MCFTTTPIRTSCKHPILKGKKRSDFDHHLVFSTCFGATAAHTTWAAENYYKTIIHCDTNCCEKKMEKEAKGTQTTIVKET